MFDKVREETSKLQVRSNKTKSVGKRQTGAPPHLSREQLLPSVTDPVIPLCPLFAKLLALNCTPLLAHQVHSPAGSLRGLQSTIVEIKEENRGIGLPKSGRQTDAGRKQWYWSTHAWPADRRRKETVLLVYSNLANGKMLEGNRGIGLFKSARSSSIWGFFFLFS
ncbi:hypothetical protein RRG08_055725 [Elysia crispata]|uniref:Uncharacterized protein n=1 Tax=Elysia crispata TaxID=231223 RepID=A0AAE1E7B2_9GAST|nr:hypothetical protein RRG08_055725 [Elysia crispata]